jgi:signal transduction histidine kinase
MINKIFYKLIPTVINELKEEKPLVYEKESRKIIYFNMISFLISFLIGLFVVIILLVTKKEITVAQYPIIIASIIFFMVPFLIKISNKYYLSIQYVFALLLNMLALFRVINTGGIDSVIVMAFSFIIIFSYLFIDEKITKVIFVLTLIKLSILYYLIDNQLVIFRNSEPIMFKYISEIVILSLIFSSFMIDNYERRRIKRIIERYRAEKKKIKKLMHFGQVSAGISHELNNYLSTIQMNIGLIDLKFKNQSPKIKEKFILIEKNIKLIEETVDSLRYLHHKDFYLSLPEEELTEILLPIIDKYNGKVDFEEIPYLKLKVNRLLVHKVFKNLLDNAINAIDGLDEQWIRISFKEYDDKLNIFITDSGQGIPKEDQDKIFESFFTTKGVNKGSGIGLDLCRTIMVKHKGDLFLNAKDKNTQFVISFKKS